MNLRAMLLLTCSLVSAIAWAQTLPDPLDTVEVLVPLRPRVVAGANDSVWATELWIHNDADVPVWIFEFGSVAAPHGFMGTPFPSAPIPPKTSYRATPAPNVVIEDLIIGSFFYIEKAHADDVYFDLRVRERSQASQSQGIQIPVVPSCAARTKQVFLNVPVSPQYRHSLRAYGWFSENETMHPRLYVYDQATGDLLANRELPVGHYTTVTSQFRLPPYPSQAHDFFNRTDFPSLEGHSDVRVEIESTSLRFWAFLTVTDNVSEAVTVLYPQAADCP